MLYEENFVQENLFYTVREFRALLTVGLRVLEFRVEHCFDLGFSTEKVFDTLASSSMCVVFICSLNLFDNDRPSVNGQKNLGILSFSRGHLKTLLHHTLSHFGKPLAKVLKLDEMFDILDEFRKTMNS